ncbi:MAG: sporulation protein YunB [Bacillota bacterium]|nr:sporulation protein YunB [Bacillota bacterium]
MKRNRKRGENGNKGFRRVALAAVVVSAVMTAGVYVAITMLVEPNMEDVTKIRAEVVVSRAVNMTLAEQFRNEKEKELFTVKSGEDGTMEMVQANSAEINILMAELSIGLQESFRKMEEEHLEVPVGALLGSKLLSQTGPDVTLSIVPLSVSSMDFKTEFETQGINQTKYKIYVVIGSRVKVISPFADDIFETSSTVLVGEAVILGKVPESFVQVPEEDILDVTPE